MGRKHNLFLAITTIALFSLSVAACVPIQTAEDTSLKMGLLPILDILPFYVADQNGYFEAEGINVGAYAGRRDRRHAQRSNQHWSLQPG
jgi:ABC-type nitrate/sulfonate/bicarbonate transport system substrate-binding protein